ncbi:BppU family phage baseplate upper protein [Bacillus cereus group sp. MYBK104-2]
MTRTISSRENDRNGFKIIVPLKERGKPVDLTGYVVKYEAISPYGNFVRDDAVVTNARDGIFEYIVSKEAVSSAGIWIGYFAFEKGTERFTTQDIRISLGNDVKQGNIPIENYIAEFDNLKKQIDALQIAVDKVDVVKKSGDTMTGTLNLAASTYLKNGTSLIIEPASSTTTSPNWRILADSGGVALVPSKTIGGADWDWSKVVRLGGDTSNLLKKTGDTMTGVFYLGNNWEHTIPGGSKGVTVVVNDSVNKWAIGPKVGGNANWANELSMDLNTGTITVTDLKTKKDTDWTNLTLLNGVTNQTGKTSKVKRTGNTVCLTVNVIGVKNNQIITTLPTAFRPLSDMGFSSSYIKSDLNSAEGIITIRADGSVHCEWISEGSTPLKFWSFTLTYLI